MGFGVLVTNIPYKTLNESEVRERLRVGIIKAIEEKELNFIYIPDDGPEMVYLKEVLDLIRETDTSFRTIMPIAPRHYLGMTESAQESYLSCLASMVEDSNCVIVAGDVPEELNDVLKDLERIYIWAEKINDLKIGHFYYV